MKSFAIVALAAMASLVNAHSPRHVHFARANSTTDGLTTLTVTATHISTIVSCAPTVTNCPANKPAMSTVPESDRSTMVVTDTVVLTTTVCPVSAAPSVSASIISAHSSGKLPGTTLTTALTPAPASTVQPGSLSTSGVVTETGSSPNKTTSAVSPSMTTSVTTMITSSTTTVTVTSGTQTSVVQSVVTDTITSTITVPCSQTGGGDSPTTEDSTTTVTSTTTSTTTITIKPVQTPGAGETGLSSPGNNGAACSCPAANTITVTASASTVTMTAPASTVYLTVGGDRNSTAPMPTGGYARVRS